MKVALFFLQDASIALAPATTVIRGDANPKLNPLDNTDIVDAKSTKARGNEIEELVSVKVKRDLQEIATDAGVATLKHYIKKFDLVPKMLKQILNPGTLRGGRQFNHYRQVPKIFSAFSVLNCNTVIFAL